MNDDDALIAAVRNGSIDAFSMLYARHHASVRRFAASMARSAAHADDLVSEAFTKVLSTIRSGGGPTSAFRVYVLATLRRLARATMDDGSPEGEAGDAGRPRNAAWAFESLPERWQTVLWHVEVEGETPSEIAPLLGLTANAVGALAYRAREGFKAAYLQNHLSDHPVDDPCHTVAGRLGPFNRGRLTTQDAKTVRSHVAACDYCRRLSNAMDGVDANIASILMAAVLGAARVG